MVGRMVQRSLFLQYTKGRDLQLLHCNAAIHRAVDSCLYRTTLCFCESRVLGVPIRCNRPVMALLFNVRLQTGERSNNDHRPLHGTIESHSPVPEVMNISHQSIQGTCNKVHSNY